MHFTGSCSYYARGARHHSKSHQWFQESSEVDKIEDWGHCSIGVVIANERADVTTQTLICSNRCSRDSQNFKCHHQG